MKILFVTPGASNRGGHIILTELVRKLREQGHTINVLHCLDAENISQEASYTWRNIDPITIVGETRDIPEHVATVERLMHKLATMDTEYDYVVLDSWRIVRGAIREGVIKEHYRQLVQSDAEFTPESPDNFWKAELFKLLPRFPLKHIHVSETISRLFKDRYGLEEPHIELGVRDEFHAVKHEPTQKERLKIIAVSGNFNIPSKGFDDLVDIAKQLDPNKYEVTIVSPQEMEIDIPLQVQQVSLSHPKDIAKLLIEHDIFVGTSHSETFGLAQAEAMTVGLPTIAFDAVGNRTYMTEENSLLARNNEDAIRLIRTLENTEERVQLSKEARESMKKWSIAEMTNQFMNILTTQ